MIWRLDLNPPVAPRLEVSIRQLGRKRVDAYAWMKYIPPMGTRTLDTLPPLLHAHLDAEIDYSKAMLQPLEAGALWFYEQMAARAPEVCEPAVDAKEEWHYGSKLPAGAHHRVFFRSRSNAEPELLFDEADRAAGHAYYRATGHQVSPDGRWFAWAEDVTGDDRHRICVLDIAHGVIYTIVAADAFGYGAFTLSPSSSYLFWIWRDEYSRPKRLYRTPVRGGESVVVYEEHDPAIFMRIARTAADGFVALDLSGSGTSETRLIPASAEDGPAQLVRPREAGSEYRVYEWNDTLVMLEYAPACIEGRLLRIDRATFAARGELVAHRPGVSIIDIRPFERALVRLERVDGLRRLVLMQDDGQEIEVAFGESAHCIDVATSQPYQADRLRVTYQTPADPPSWVDIDLRSGRRRDVGQTEPRGFDSAHYQVERLLAQAPDGEQIPITILSRRDAAGPRPVLLTGYGAYGIASEPRFSLPATVLVDAGFRYAIAHVRGGSEKGRRWFLEGCRDKKRNSMTDFVACARHLLQHGYAAPGKIVAQGISAGGLLVCGAMNLVPELWAGVIAQVPFVDMLNTMSDADHPLVPLFRPDWGDPLADPKAYDSIAAISPYENVRAAAYPPILCTAGLKDDRVPYWEPAKLLANIRFHSTSANPAILDLDLDSGHQETDDQGRRFAQAARLWAFACQCAAVPLPTDRGSASAAGCWPRAGSV